MTTLSFVVPCYNEQDGIPRLLTALEDTRQALAPAYRLELVFVDDGSVDRTAELLTAACHGQANARVLSHPANRGLGAALRTGVAAATGTLVATADSDCTYDPRQVLQMLRELERGADLVVASPYHPEGRVTHVPAYRQLLSRNLSRLYRWVLGSRIYTYTSLFRLYRAEVLRSVPWRSDGFLAMAEILVEALLKGYRVVEYPTQLVARQQGASKAVILPLVMDHLRFLGQLLRRRARVPRCPPAPQDARPQPLLVGTAEPLTARRS